jgi:hypothetical protein
LFHEPSSAGRPPCGKSAAAAKPHLSPRCTALATPPASRKQQTISPAIERIWFFAFALLLIFATPRGAFAEEQRFAAYNCALTLPAGWVAMPNLPAQPGLIAGFINGDKTSIFMLMIDDRHKPAGPMDDAFIAGLNRGIEASGGGKMVSGRFIEIAGLQAYERLGTVSAKGREASTIIYAIPANGRFYSVQAICFSGEASTNPDILKALGSFRFLSAPVPPPQYSPENTLAYRIGQLMGIVLMIIFLFGVVFWILRLVTRRSK